MQQTLVTHSAEETEAFGFALAERMQKENLPPFIALYGDLGVGKTAFTRGFVKFYSPKITVKSPTFTLVNEYKGTTPVFHFDMYRIESEDDLYSIGFDDYLVRGGICVVEWSEKIPYALPEHYLKITIQKSDVQNVNARSIQVEEVL